MNSRGKFKWCEHLNSLESILKHLECQKWKEKRVQITTHHKNLTLDWNEWLKWIYHGLSVFQDIFYKIFPYIFVYSYEIQTISCWIQSMNLLKTHTKLIKSGKIRKSERERERERQKQQFYMHIPLISIGFHYFSFTFFFFFFWKLIKIGGSTWFMRKSHVISPIIICGLIHMKL